MKKIKAMLRAIGAAFILTVILFVVKHYFLPDIGVMAEGIVEGGVVLVLWFVYSTFLRKGKEPDKRTMYHMRNREKILFIVALLAVMMIIIGKTVVRSNVVW